MARSQSPGTPALRHAAADDSPRCLGRSPGSGILQGFECPVGTRTPRKQPLLFPLPGGLNVTRTLPGSICILTTRCPRIRLSKFTSVRVHLPDRQTTSCQQVPATSRSHLKGCKSLLRLFDVKKKKKKRRGWKGSQRGEGIASKKTK